MTARMPDIHARALLLLAGAAGTWLALTQSSVDPWRASACALVVVTCTTLAGLALVYRQRVAQRRSQAILDALGHQIADLPVAIRARLPVVLVTGDATTALFDRDGEGPRLIHRGHGAIWVRVDALDNLPYVAWALKQWRGGHAPDAILLTVTPGTHDDPASLSALGAAARQMAADTARLLGQPVPGYVATYCPWTAAVDDTLPVIGFSRASCSHPSPDLAGLGIRLAHAAPKDARVMWQRTIAGYVLAWTADHLVPALMIKAGTVRPWPMHGMAWINAGPIDCRSFYYRKLTQTTGLAPGDADRHSTLPFPDALLAGLPRARTLPLSWRTASLASSLLCLTVALGSAVSYRYNEALIERSGKEVARFLSLDPQHDEIRRDALAQLVRTRDELDTYQRVGVPAYLGLGLHDGTPLIARLNAAIASYVPPGRLPAIVTLDGLSLFDAGKATLRPGSLHAMTGATHLIHTHPDKRVLIAGHTDDAGDARANLRLSLARAAAVRDWLSEATGLPETQFGIQGYGDTRPTADNRTPEGRARNRRVEITLIPDRETL